MVSVQIIAYLGSVGTRTPLPRNVRAWTLSRLSAMVPMNQCNRCGVETDVDLYFYITGASQRYYVNLSHCHVCAITIGLNLLRLCWKRKMRVTCICVYSGRLCAYRCNQLASVFYDPL